jgi:CheY-like chemotaxis protein
MGYRADVAGNGIEVLESVERQSYDVILMDVQMPEMDGLEATKIIRTREADKGKHVPIIAMTAHALKGDRKLCLDAGMDEYISKPIRIQQLAEKFALVVGGHEGESMKDCSSDNGQVINLEEALQGVSGDKDLLRELILLFQEEGQRLLNDVRDAVQRTDVNQLQIAAHTLKGALLALYAHGPAEHATRLEALARENNMAEAPTAFADLERQMQRLRQVLAEFV